MAVRADQVGNVATANDVWLFNDVLTTGAHFKAAARRIREIHPQARIRGFFIARRVPEGVEFDFGSIDD